MLLAILPGAFSLLISINYFQPCSLQLIFLISILKTAMNNKTHCHGDKLQAISTTNILICMFQKSNTSAFRKLSMKGVGCSCFYSVPLRFTGDSYSQRRYRQKISNITINNYLQKQKSGLDFSVETTHLFPQSSAFASAFRLSLSSTNATSAISFRLPSDSISAAASSDSPLSSTFVSDVSGPSIPRLIAASFPLSDPRCFGFLSSASVLGSDYSASAFPFLLFPVPPRSCFPGARFRSRFLGFPFLSGLISHAFLPGSCTRLSVRFLSPFPASLPQLLVRCLPHALAFGLSPSDPLPFVRFSSGSDYSALCSSFP